jgi:chromosome segregation ATPase
MSDLRGTITNAAKSAAKTSGDLLKSAKLNMNLSSAEGSLKNLHFEIGKKVHEIYQNGGTLNEHARWFDEKYSQIVQVEKNICEIKEQLDELRGIRKCPKCEKQTDRASEFCSKCGIRFEIAETIAATVSETVIEEPETPPAAFDMQRAAPPPRKCRVCGSENDALTKFCFSCGRLLD